MDLHFLDLGTARFTEFGVFFVLSGKVDIHYLRDRVTELLQVWPILNMKMNLPRDRLLHSNGSDRQIYWESKTLSQDLSIYYPDLDQKKSSGFFASHSFHQFFDSWSSLRDHIFSPAFYVQVLQLNDACLFNLIVQHPLCDASGLYQIFDALASLTKGKTISPLAPRCSITLEKKLATTQKSHQTHHLYTQLAKTQVEAHIIGWRPIITQGIKAAVSRSQRVSAILVVSKPRIQIFRQQAIDAGVSVTDNDILLACILKALRASPNRERLGKERNGYPPFGFIMNIKRQLKESRGIHNSWVLITLPTPVIEDNSSEDTVISLAAHIRLTIERVRSPECLEPLIDMHRNARPKPIAARDLASKPPLTVVSSCIQPWYQTEFQINPDTTARPRHIEIFCRGSGILKRMVKVEHLIFTWKDELDQFCLRGVLATEVWKELQGYLL